MVKISELQKHYVANVHPRSFSKFDILHSSQDTIYKDQAKKIICQNIQRNRNDRNRTFRNV